MNLSKFLSRGAIVAALLIGASAHAADPYDLKTLDVLGTCTPGTVKEQNAKNALSFLNSFVTWHVRDQIRVLHPDFISWHSSLAGLLEAKPEMRGKVPFDKGQYNGNTYLQTMTFLAYFNDIDDYVVAPTRVDCVGDDRVVLVTQFKGVQLKREPKTGCVTHRVPFGSPTKIGLQFKDVEVAPRKFVSRVYRSESYLDDEASVKVRQEMEIEAKKPALPPDPKTCKTMDAIAKDLMSR